MDRRATLSALTAILIWRSLARAPISGVAMILLVAGSFICSLDLLRGHNQ